MVGARLSRGTGLAAVLLTALAAADPVVIEGLPPVPNPFGFDDRLALRTHLEERYGQGDVVGRSFEELVERYRAVTAPPPPPRAGPARAPREDEAAAAARVQRENILLQLRRQFGVIADPALATDELERMLSRRIAEDLARAPAPSEQPPVDGGTARTDHGAGGEGRPAVAVTRFDPATLPRPAGVLDGVGIDTGERRVLGICFSDDLVQELRPIVGAATVTMVRARAAATCLVLLGHGDGTMIGAGGPQPVDITRHLQANREAYHRALRCERIDCVAILSCSRRHDRQFTAFHNGLGYRPTWRVSAWENCYQNGQSGLAALRLALAQPIGSQLRAAVFVDDAQEIGSLAEVGERTSTSFLRARIAGDRMDVEPVRRAR